MKSRGLPEVSSQALGRLKGVLHVDRRSVVGMETAPKPGRGDPPKKDKPQAKRKKPRRYWEEEPTPSAAGASPGPPRKKARTGEPRPPRSQSARIAQKPRFSKKPPIPKNASDWKKPQRTLSGVSPGLTGWRCRSPPENERNRVHQNLPLTSLPLDRLRTRSQDLSPPPWRWPGSSAVLTSPKR